MWYNHLDEYLLKEECNDDLVCPCVFIKKSKFDFAIIVMYIENLNIIETHRVIPMTINYLMKDLVKIKFYLTLLIEHLTDENFIHRSTYINKVLEKSYMDKTHLMSTPMVVQSLDVRNNPFRPHKDNKELLDHELQYLNAIGAQCILLIIHDLI